MIMSGEAQLKCRLDIMMMPSIDERGRLAAAMGRFGRTQALVTADAKIHRGR